MKHFCCLGPGKSGTTWLFELTVKHNAFAKPVIKEQYFFTDNLIRGYDWYKKNFRFNENTVVFGDIGNQYYKNLSCLRNCLDFDPDTIFIYCLRDPVERFFSAYKFELMQGRSLSPFQYLDEWDLTLFDDRSTIGRILNEVCHDRLFFIKFDDIVKRPVSVLANINRIFDCVDDVKTAELATNRSVLPRSRLLTRAGRNVAGFLRNKGYFGTLQVLKNSRLVSSLIYGKQVVQISAAEILEIEKFIQRDSFEDFHTGLASESFNTSEK